MLLCHILCQYYRMKLAETASKPSNSQQDNRQPIPRHLTYQKVKDGRKQPIRGLWMRNGNFYARLTVEDQNSGEKSVRRVRLEDARTVADATMALKQLQTKREDNALPVLKRTPKFSDYVTEYLGYHEQVKDSKRASTLETERGHLNRWVEHLKETRLDKITKPMITKFIALRKGEKVNGRTISGRTVNLAVVCLRNVLHKAIDEGWIQRLPTENLRPLKWTAKRKNLISSEEVEKLCKAATEVSKNGEEFANYIKFMAYCGSRMSETLRLKWQDVDFPQKQVTIGSDGLAKNHKARVVDFNKQLESLLEAMVKHRAPDSEFLFPSPQRGKTDKPAKTLRETLILARNQAGLPQFGFHDCRHFFISYCVMSGIDYMTIARWVGHADGGILIGKVYGHLTNDHAQRQARKLNFESPKPEPQPTKQ